MANLQRIKDIAFERGMLLSDIAEKIGMTPAGMSLILKKNSTTIDTLEEISKVLGVHPGVFFDGYVGPQNATNINPAIKDLQVELAAKETIIEQLNKIIESKSELIRELSANR